MKREKEGGSGSSRSFRTGRAGRYKNGTGPGQKTERGRALKDEREVVLLALLSLEKNDTFSNVLVKRTLDDCADLRMEERAFIKRLLEGVIERRTELDDRIQQYTGKSVQRLHPAVRQALRMGIYQILYMDAVPDSAACNESVRLAKKHGPARLSGLVNGVLRSAARDAASGKDADRAKRADQPGTAGKKASGSGGSADDPDCGERGSSPVKAHDQPETEDWIRDRSIRFSTPDWLVRMWEEQLGREETQALLAALMEIRPVPIRLRGGLSAEEKVQLLEQLRNAGVQVEAGRWLPDALQLRRTSDLRRLPGFAEGKWTVQDESSMLAVAAAGLRGGETVYDVCAAPGGKSFFAAELAAPGPVHAFDLSRRKTDRIREGAARMGLSNLVIEERDARLFYPAEEGAADVVLCDLPCSGLGVIGKKRDIKYRASLEGISSLQTLQREILSSAAHYVKKGGILLYTTCSISRAENEDNAAWIAGELGLEPEDLAPYLPAGIPGIRGNILQLLPHVHGTDGFFIARFCKN